MTRDAAVAALCQPELASVVDLVCWVEDGMPYAANHLGRVRWPDDQTREVVAGVDPIGSEDPMAFLPYAREVAAASPAVSTENAYPYPAARIRSLFADSDRSPDLAIVHTPRHFFPEQGGHVGEHGSLDVVQARAPFIVAGKGVARLGTIDGAIRMTDVAPTIAALLGLPEVGGLGLNGTYRPDARLGRQDGDVIDELLDSSTGAPAHVVGFLLDGTNPNVLDDFIAAGDLPHLARIAGSGTTLRFGVMSARLLLTNASTLPSALLSYATAYAQLERQREHPLP
jgi:hypothetical protein